MAAGCSTSLISFYLSTRWRRFLKNDANSAALPDRCGRAALGEKKSGRTSGRKRRR
jgi:hypothetical protein